MKKVSFTEMDKGTKEDYLFLDQHEKDYASKTADRIIKFLSNISLFKIKELSNSKLLISWDSVSGILNFFISCLYLSIVPVLLIFFWSWSIPYIKASAVGGHPGT